MAYCSDFRHALLATTAVVMAASAGPAWAQTKTFNVAAQPAASGVADFARQADVQILVSAADVRGRRTAAVRGEMAVDAGLRGCLNREGIKFTALPPSVSAIEQFAATLV